MGKPHRKIHLANSKGQVQCKSVRAFQLQSYGVMSLDRFVDQDIRLQCRNCKQVADRWQAKRSSDEIKP
jgi:hypothetical protein